MGDCCGNAKTAPKLGQPADYPADPYSILLPASAVPGWPADASLPVDPQWKHDYAASVQRLIRDGVDVPLANLFVHVARPVPPDADGAGRARSASEAFLYRRLETLPETAGRFRLNAELPIAFDGWGRMEVDLYLSAPIWKWGKSAGLKMRFSSAGFSSE